MITVKSLPVRGIALGALLACAAAATAQNGPLRELLRERVAERAGQNVTPQPARRLGAGEKITAPGRYEIRLRHGGRERMALVHVPKSHDTSRPTPLVMA